MANVVDILITARDKASGPIKGATEQLRKMRGPLLAIGVAATAMGVLSVKAASDLEESINAVNVVFGKAADTVLEFGKGSARAVGLATAEFNQLSAVVGAMLIDTGIPLKDVADKTNEIAVRAADMASVMNTSVQDALNAMRSALMGQSEPIRRYTGDVTDATLNQYLLAQGLSTTTADMNEQEKRLLRLSVVMQQTNKFAGDFENTSESFANSMKILRAEVTNLGANMGTILLPGIGKVTSLLGKATAALNGLSPTMQKVVVGGVALTAILAAVALVIPPLVAGFSMLGAAMTVALGPVGLIVLGIAGLIAVGVLLYKNWDKVKAVGQTTWHFISKFLDTTVGKIAVLLLGPIGIGLLLIKNWEKVKEAAISVFGAVRDTIKKAFSGIAEMVTKPLQSILDAIKRVADALPSWVPGIEDVHKFTVDALQAIGEEYDKHKTKVVESAEAIEEKLVPAVEKLNRAMKVKQAYMQSILDAIKRGPPAFAKMRGDAIGFMDELGEDLLSRFAPTIAPAAGAGPLLEQYRRLEPQIVKLKALGLFDLAAKQMEKMARLADQIVDLRLEDGALQNAKHWQSIADSTREALDNMRNMKETVDEVKLPPPLQRPDASTPVWRGRILPAGGSPRPTILERSVTYGFEGGPPTYGEWRPQDTPINGVNITVNVDTNGNAKETALAVAKVVEDAINEENTKSS
jgi:hypothetical protein